MIMYVCGTRRPFMRDIGQKCEPFNGDDVSEKFSGATFRYYSRLFQDGEAI